MSTDNVAEIPPIKAHVVKDDTKGPRPRRRPVFRSLTLTSAKPVAAMCGTDPGRRGITAQAIGNDVVLAATEAQAQAAANEASGIPNPEGYLLAHANTAPTHIDTTEVMWAAAASYPATVTYVLLTETEA